MPSYLLSQERKKLILLGNEAVVRGALESGVSFASTYPGTPASEIGDTFFRIAEKADIYFEYSTNEKVALEAAAGAAFSGLKSIVSMKHFGLNVAADSFLPIVYVGASPMVIAVSDDPSCHSSAQSEQDTRYYARLAHIPMLEPSDPAEAKEFTKLAFVLSKKYQIPFLLRLTTRVSHTRGIVTLDKLVEGKEKGKFVKDLEKYNNLPPHTMRMHEQILKKVERVRVYSERGKVNFIRNRNPRSRYGIIASGVSFNYVMDALREMGLEIPVLKLSLTYPLPSQKIEDFISNRESVLVVEELEPFVEEKVRELAKEANPKLKICGKNGYLPKSGEFDIALVAKAIYKFTDKQHDFDFEAHSRRYEKLKVPQRFAIMCPGCQHRATFWAVRQAVKESKWSEEDVIYGGDIGCYILGIYPPYRTADHVFSMGASEGISHGISQSTDQKAIAFVGDSTFFHAGVPGLINSVYNKSNPLIIILDNRITAMTGHQPCPSTGLTGMHEKIKPLEIGKIAKACGVKHVQVVDPFNVNKMIGTVKEFLDKKETAVIVSRRQCQLLATRRKKKKGIPIPKYQIDQDKCTKCGLCLHKFACPAIYEEKGEFRIDEHLCTGCSVCAQICPANAIEMKK